MEETDYAYLAGIIDGEGTITLTRQHSNEHRRPVITIASTDFEILLYIQNSIGGHISKKKNYSPEKHKDSFVISIKNKKVVLYTLQKILPYLKIPTKIKRAELIIYQYEQVTPRNGKYNKEVLIKKKKFEEDFFSM